MEVCEGTWKGGRQLGKGVALIGEQPVYVESLVIRGTIEEDIVRIRTERTTHESLQAKTMMHDGDV